MRTPSLKLLPVLLMLLPAASMSLWGASAIAGEWNFFTTAPDGAPLNWSLTVKEEDGKLSGFLSGSQGIIPLVNPKFEGDLFTCSVTVDGGDYSVELKVTGNTAEGSWKGGADTGKIKASKKSAK